MSSTIPNPFYVDLSDPKYSRYVQKLMQGFQSRRPSMIETQKKLVNINSKLDKKRLQLETLSEEIPPLMLELLIWKKYLQHKQQQDQQKLAVEEEEVQLQLAQMELEKKKAELNERKRISTKRPMLNTADAPSLDNFQASSDKIQIIVVDMVGKSHPVEVIPTSTIDELFHYVFSGFQDIPKEDCALRTDSKTLELGKTFAEQGVEDSTRVHMFIRQRGGGKKTLRKLATKRRMYQTQPSFTAKLFYANENELDDIFKKLEKEIKSESDASVSLGDDSERSGADEEYRRPKDPNWVPKEDDEGDEEGDSFDDCEHEWLNSAGLCFDCGAEVGAHPTPAPCFAPSFPTTPFQPKK